jgi:8-oxo-dGTP pyrophosphatase MutT (NUDIX family)
MTFIKTGTPLPEGVLEVLHQAEDKYRVRRAHAEMGTARGGLDIRERSRKNFEAVRRSLREGLAAPQSTVRGGTSASAPPRPPEAAEGETLMTHKEAEVFERLLNAFTLRHATHALKDMGNTLLSVKQREREARAAAAATKGVARHTPTNLHEDDSVFFVAGVGHLHSTPKFLVREHGAQPEVITIHMERAARQRPDLLQGIWVGPHLTNVEENYQHAAVDLGATRFEFFMDQASQTTRFVFKRAGQPAEETRLRFEQQIFEGPHVGPGLCYTFIDMLRRVGDPYRQHLLEALTDSAVPGQHKDQLLAAAMAHLMPGTVNLEVKVPVAVSLEGMYRPEAQPRRRGEPLPQPPAEALIDVSRAPADGSFDWLTQDGKDRYPKFKAAVERGRIDKVGKYLEGVDWSTIRHARLYKMLFSACGAKTAYTPFFDDQTPKVATPTPEQAQKVLALFIERGVTAFGDDITPDALDYALHCEVSPALVDQLLRATFADRRDPRIRQRAPAGRYDILAHALRQPGLLPVFAENGVALAPHASALLTQHIVQAFHKQRSDGGHVTLGAEFDLLLQHGAGQDMDEPAAMGVLVTLVVVDAPGALAKLLDQTCVDLRHPVPEGHSCDGGYVGGGITLLHAAAAQFSVESVRTLLSRGAPVSAAQDSGLTPLGRLLLGRRQLVEVHEKRAQEGSVTPRERDNHAAMLAKSQACEALLMAAGATPPPPNFEPKVFAKRRMFVQVVMTGQDAAGKRAVVIGQLRHRSGLPSDDWQLPGGLMMYTDGTSEKAARRYIEEQTGLTATALARLFPGQLPKAYAFEHEGISGASRYRHDVYSVDLGPVLSTSRLDAAGDWSTLKVVPEDAAPTLLTDVSHTAIAKAVLSGDFTPLHRALALDHDSFDLLQDARKRGALKDAQALYAEGLRFSPREGELLLQQSCEANDVAFVRWYVSLGVNLDADLLEEAFPKTHGATLAALLERVDTSTRLYVDAVDRAGEQGGTPEAATRLSQHLLANPSPYPSIYNSALLLTSRNGLWELATELLQHCPGERYFAKFSRDSQKIPHHATDASLARDLKAWAKAASKAGHKPLSAHLLAMVNPRKEPGRLRRMLQRF